MERAEMKKQFHQKKKMDAQLHKVGQQAARNYKSTVEVKSNFSCTRPYLLTVAASDNVRFVIDSSSGNEYEVGLNNARLTMLKLA